VVNKTYDERYPGAFSTKLLVWKLTNCVF